MKRAVAIALVLGVGSVMAAARSSAHVPPFPKVLINAKYVYVTSYDGDQFNPNLLREDRQAIAAVEEALQKWGRFVIVYRPQDADLVMMVESRPSEDVLVVYDGQRWPEENFLWRVMGRGGLQQGETPLVHKLEKAVEEASK